VKKKIILSTFSSVTTPSQKMISLYICSSSPELKCHVSFSDRPVSFVSVRLSLQIYIFDFSKTSVPILAKLETYHLWGNVLKFLEIKGSIFLSREIIAK
jgi:hypothetical protein